MTGLGASDNAGTFSKEFFPGLDTVINTSAHQSIYYIHNVYNSVQGFFGLFFCFVLGTFVIADYVKGWTQNQFKNLGADVLS